LVRLDPLVIEPWDIDFPGFPTAAIAPLSPIEFDLRHESLLSARAALEATRAVDFDVTREAMLAAREALTTALPPTMALDAPRAQAAERAAQRALEHGLSMPTPAIAPGGAWASPRFYQGDPADSLYRSAHELLRRGEYRRAATIFRELPQRFPSSAYLADALYWQAFALYRIGGSAELRAALEALDQHRSRYPGAKNRVDAAQLTTRITGALANRGDAAAIAQLRNAATDSALRCDREELQVRAEALNALSQSDPDGAVPLLQRTLERRDECTAPLRRTAVLIVGSKRKDAAAVALLSQVARTDPSYEVRSSALDFLSRLPGDEALGVLDALARDASDERMQRTAVRALARSPSPRARQVVRALVERSETPERVRYEAIAAFDKERSTSEDIAWLRTLYTRSTDSRFKGRLVQTLANIGGPDVDQWMLTLARNTEEDSETRRYALRRVARTLPVADIARLYDTAAERPVRESLIEALAERPEAEAADKLVDIVKTGTDPQLRRQAINALTRKKDPRTTRLLLEIIDK
jgi:TolA-binding protein